MFERVLNKHLLTDFNCAYRWNHIAAFTQKNYLVEKMRMVWNRSSHQRCSLKKPVLKNFEMFTGKHLRWSLFLIKSQAKACNLIKKRVQRRGFPVNIVKSLRTPILKNICERLLLNEETLKNFDDYMVTAEVIEKCYLFYLQCVVNYSIIFCCVWQISQLLHCGRFHRNWFPRFGKK